MTIFSFFRNLSRRVYLAGRTSVLDAKYEKVLTNRNIQPVAAFRNWLKNDNFLTFDPHFPQNAT